MGLREDHEKAMERQQAKVARQGQALASLSPEQNEGLKFLCVHPGRKGHDEFYVTASIADDVSVVDALALFPPTPLNVYKSPHWAATYGPPHGAPYHGERVDYLNGAKADVTQVGPVRLVVQPKLGVTAQSCTGHRIEAKWWTTCPQDDALPVLWEVAYALPPGRAHWCWVKGARGSYGHYEFASDAITAVTGRHRPDPHTYHQDYNQPREYRFVYPCQGGGSDPAGSIPDLRETTQILLAIQHYRALKSARGWLNEAAADEGWEDALNGADAKPAGATYSDEAYAAGYLFGQYATGNPPE